MKGQTLLEKALLSDAERLTDISKRAFDSDLHCGGTGPGGPPGYDSVSWQKKMIEAVDYYKIMLNGDIIGGIIVSDEGGGSFNLARMYIAPDYFEKGYGLQSMGAVLARYPGAKRWWLDTPAWNTRTRPFYLKAGFKIKAKKEDFLIFEKLISEGELMMKALNNCQWRPKWVSHLGCIKGCLDYLGIEVSDAWLYGGTGHAFVINMHEVVCPSGPTAWKTVKLFELGKNLGYRIEGIFGFKNQDHFAELQERAWVHARQAIDQGWPCYGWELEVPEYYVVYDYDEAGYFFSGPGCDEGKGPKPWRELGDTEIGLLELYSVWPGRAADDATTVKQALSFALEHAANSEEWILEHYRAGAAGFDNWISALQAGKASDMGMRYNAGVWLECRQQAVGFLKEARERLAGQADGLFDEAQAHYQAVAENLEKVAQAYPWLHGASDKDLLPIDDRSCAAVETLQAAKKAEEAGLRALERIVGVL